MTLGVSSGLMKAMLDAIHGSDEKIGGQAITTLRVGLDPTATEILVTSTIGFGEFKDGLGNGRVVVGSEIIDFSARAVAEFTGLTRGVQSTIVQPRYPAGTIVYDEAQNASAIDHVRRGFLVNFALGEDLNIVGRNLGLKKCVGVPDDTWREVIREVAYLAKQPLGAIETALNALLGAGNFELFERAVTQPHKFFVVVAQALATDLTGKFFVNSGEPQVTQGGAIVDVDYPIASTPFIGAAAAGSIRGVSGAFLIDGEVFVLNDGVNPAVTFEFDDDSSVVPSATLRPVDFTSADTEEDVRDAMILAITSAPTLAIDPTLLSVNLIALLNAIVGVAGNQTITSTVADPVWAVTGMAGGQDAGVQGVVGVYEATVATLEGVRDGQTNLFTGGSFVGQQVTLGTDPGAGVDVLVDYNAFQAHYAPEEVFRNDGTDFPPYFSDNLLATRCLVDQVRAAGTSAELSVAQ